MRGELMDSAEPNSLLSALCRFLGSVEYIVTQSMDEPTHQIDDIKAALERFKAAEDAMKRKEASR